MKLKIWLYIWVKNNGLITGIGNINYKLEEDQEKSEVRELLNNGSIVGIKYRDNMEFRYGVEISSE